ncbi:hypothetical protein [Roseovarius mucosus]|uniref:hypothetical protein n=1 Tax=Roseovarius mucosus TaxID=215743 RepID=UPI0035D05AA1
MNVKEMVFRGEDETKLYACGKCGLCYSTAIYAATSETAHLSARRAAERCCAPVHCSGCGVEVGKSWTACASCREKNKLRRATPIPAADWNDPVEVDGMHGEWGDGYSSCPAELLNTWEEENWVEVGPQPQPPAYCWPCTSRLIRLDAENLLESAVDDMHEDAADQIVDADELVAFIEAWNAKQTCRSWYPDHSRVVVLDEARFAALIAGGN